MSLIYAITNQKGGVGKSTTCLNLGAALGEQGKRVLLVDLDPQSGLTSSLGLRSEDFSETIYNVFIDPEHIPLSKVVHKTNIQNLALVPSNLDLAGAEGELLGEIGWDRTLKQALAQDSTSYDFILLDCPPSLGIITTNALIAAHTALVPVQTEYLALKGLGHLQRIIAKVRTRANPDLRLKILRTMHQLRVTHSREAVEELEKVFGSDVYRTIIKRTVKFADSTLAGEPILSYAPDSEGALAYRNLAEEILHNATQD